MKRNDLSKYREEFNRAIDRAIKECSRKTGATDLETVYTFLKKSASMLLRRLRVLLADEQFRILIQKRLKHCEVSEEEAAASTQKEALQMEFDFFEMEQFRGVPKRISYRTEQGKVEYVEYNRSTQAQRRASIMHLDSGIAADIARRNAEVASDAWLEPLVNKFGDLPAEQLVALWLRGQKGKRN